MVKQPEDHGVDGAPRARGRRRLRLELENLERREVPATAPILNGADTFTPITRQAFTNSGDLVSTLINGQVVDTNPGAQVGIAVDGANPANGAWQYSIDFGTTWSSLPAVSDQTALLLANTDRLRFIPDGTHLDMPTVSFRAWDSSLGGTHGSIVSAVPNGGTTPYSSAVGTSSLLVTIMRPDQNYANFTTGDVNRDKRQDLIRFNTDGSWTVGISLATGLRVQTWAQWLPSAHWLYTGVGDFNRDGKADVIGFSTDGSIWVGLSNGSRFMTSKWTTFTAPPTSWNTFLVGDFNGDHRDDLLAYNNDGTVWVALSTGAHFKPERWTHFASPPSTWHTFLVADFTGDGKDDLAAFSQDGSWWMSVSTGRAFINQRWSQWSLGKNWSSVVAGDFNHDGRADVAAQSASGSWWVGLARPLTNGVGSFRTTLWLIPPNGLAANVAAFTGDANGDGKADVITFASDGSWYVLLSNGQKFHMQKWAQWPPSSNWSTVLAADFQGNHRTGVFGFNVAGFEWLGESTRFAYVTTRWS
jgi:hypothetical protein